MSIKSVMPSNHLILGSRLLLSPRSFPVPGSLLLEVVSFLIFFPVNNKYFILSMFNIPKETFTQIREINITQQTFIPRFLFERQQPLYKGIPCHVLSKASLSLHI